MMCPWFHVTTIVTCHTLHCPSPSLLDEPLVQADAALLASVERHLDTIMTVDEMLILDAEHILLLKIVQSLFNDSKTAFRPYFKKVLRAPSLFYPSSRIAL